MILIYGIREQLNPIKHQMSDVLQACLHKVLGLPESKRAHRFIPMDKDDFYYPQGRTDAYTVIEINIITGRSPETQKLLIKEIFAKFDEELNIKPADVEITIKEAPAHCWGFRGMTGDEARDLTYKINV